MNKFASVLLAGALSSCGGGGGGGGAPSTEIGTPLEQIPISARGIIELGPISGGNVTLIRTNGQSIGSFTTASDGSINYNPRDIVSKIGNDAYIIATVSGGQDIDADDDGYVDATPTPVGGSFRMIILRSTLERGEGIIANPKAGIISESILGRTNSVITQAALDHISRQTGAEDQNGDGIVDYADVYGNQMKNTTGVSRVVPAVSGYISSIHAGDEAKKRTALKNVAKTENHLLLTIIPNPDTKNHTPALKIQSISGGTILYTLDGSSPLPGGSTTKTANGELIIPMQDAKLYFREQFVLNGETILGKVSGFDLMTDWTELSQTAVKYNKNLSKNPITENFSYKNTSYQISATQANISAGYEYPKQIDCSVGGDAGCQFGPYLAWSASHETAIKNIIHSSTKAYIDAGTIPPSPLEDKYRDNILYNGANYSIVDTWTRGPNGTRIFPVRIDITIRWNNGKADYTSNKTVNSQAELDSMHRGLETSIKELIDNANIPPGIKGKNTLEVIQNWTDYNSSRYMIQIWWNTTGSTKTNYPTTVQGIYRSPKTGGNIELNYTVNSDLERITKVSELPGILKGKIDAETSLPPTPTCNFNELKKENYTNYRGAYYQSVTLCNMSGSADYPMKIHAEYTLPGSSIVYTTPNPETAYNDNQRIDYIKYHLSVAKGRIDAALDDRYPPSYSRTTPIEYYGGGSYFFTIEYSKMVGEDFPATLLATVRYINGKEESVPILSDAKDEGQISASMESYKLYAKGQIDNYNPTYSPNTTMSDGPYIYGSLKGDYTIKVKYNRTGENKNYPALIWIEFRERAGGPPLDTRNIRAIGPKYANNSVEKESIKADLESQIKQRLALNTIDSSTLFARNTRRSVMDMLIPSAHAQGTSYVTIQKSPIKYGVTFPDPTTAFTPFLANGTSANLYVKRQENKASVGASSPEKIPLKLVLSEIQNSAEQIHMIKQCSGAGTTSDKQYGCTLSPSEQTQITALENKIFASIGNYLNFGGGLTVGAGAAVYEEIMGIGSDVVDLVDGTMLQSLESGLTRLKSQIEPYIANGSIDFARVKSSLISGATAIEQEIASLITELPGAINSLDSYNKGYYTGKIGGGIILEFVNPTKKLKLVTRGFSAGKWASTARYIIDAVKAGHSGPKMAEIAEKMRYVNWSRTIPDMSKITNSKITENLNKWYRPVSTIGNKSTADAIRYTKTTGLLVGDLTPSDHLDKGQQIINFIDNAKLGKHGTLSSYELSILEEIAKDTENALKGN